MKYRILFVVACAVGFGQERATVQRNEVFTVCAVLRDEIALAGAHDVEVRDGLAFIAGKGGALAIVDIRQPESPALMWSAREKRLYEDAQTVLPLGGKLLLVGTRDVHVFDIANPLKPAPLATITDRTAIDRVNGFARLGDTVFGANKNGRVFALDISTPERPRFLGSRNTRQRDDVLSPHDVAFAGDLLIVVDGRSFGRGGAPGRVAVYRVIDAASRRALRPDEWVLLGTVTDGRFAGANRVVTRGHFAYIGSSLAKDADRNQGFGNNVSVLDLTVPAQPRPRGRLAFPDIRGPNGLAIAGSIVFAAGGRTVQAIDVAQPDDLRELGLLTDAALFPGGEDDGHDLVYHSGRLLVTAQTSHALVILTLADAVRARIE